MEGGIRIKYHLRVATRRVPTLPITTTYSGVPQGSIVSPILANVVLHEFDLFMSILKDQCDAGKRRKANAAYIHYSNKINRLRRNHDTLKGKGAPSARLQEVKRTIQRLKQTRRKYLSSDPFDPNYRLAYYCRYATISP